MAASGRNLGPRFNHSSVKDMLIGWQGFCTRKKIIKVWMAAPICLFWIVWRERNGAMFENMVPSAQGWKILFYVLSGTSQEIDLNFCLFWLLIFCVCRRFRGWYYFSFPLFSCFVFAWYTSCMFWVRLSFFNIFLLVIKSLYLL